MHQTKLMQYSERLLVVLLPIGALSVLSVVALAHRGAVVGAGPARAGGVREALQARASPSSTLLGLSAAQAACVGAQPGALADFARQPVAEQEAVLQNLAPCVDRREGRPTPTPIPLNAAQRDCLKFVGGVAAFRRMNVGQQHSALNQIAYCVDGELGLPLPPAPTLRPGGYGTPLATPRTQPAGAGVIAEGGKNSGDIQDTFLNAWGEGEPWGSISVWAGSSRDDPLQGVVFVVAERNTVTSATAPPGLVFGLRVYPTPSKHGAVRVLDATGRVLALRAQDGTRFYFDAGHQRFVSAPAATATPPATVTPVRTATPAAR